MLVKKVPDTSGLVNATVLNATVSDVDNKISDAISLVTTNVLNKKISEVENKILHNFIYVATQEYIKLATKHFGARLKQADLVNKTDFIIY